MKYLSNLYIILSLLPITSQKYALEQGISKTDLLAPDLQWAGLLQLNGVSTLSASQPCDMG